MARSSKQNPFADNLNRLMQERRITVRRAAEIAGTGVSTVQAWRSGALPTDYLAVKRLAHEFRVSLAFLLTGEEDSTNTKEAPSVTEVLQDGGMIFDGYAKITIQRLLPRGGKDE